MHPDQMSWRSSQALDLLRQNLRSNAHSFICERVTVQRLAWGDAAQMRVLQVCAWVSNVGYKAELIYVMQGTHMFGPDGLQLHPLQLCKCWHSQFWM